MLNLNLNFVLKIIIPVSAVVVISRTFPQFSFFYYLLPLLFLFIIFAGYKYVLKDKVLTILLLLLFTFGLWSAVTSLWSDYPLVTLSRSGYFIFISFGAVLAGYLWQQLNFTPLSFLLAANIIVVALSLFSLITNIPADSWTGGNAKGFMGFAGHQNTLASAILFTIPAVYYKIFPSPKGSLAYGQAGKRGGYLVLLLLNLLFLILTYSRTSILALVIGAVVFLLLSKKSNVLIYSSAVALLILCLIWFTPYLKEKANELVKKDFPEFYSSRQWLWEPSYDAALSGGLTGLGYGISHPEIIVEGTGSHYDNGRYIREKGNSFLALIEEAGIVGLVLFLLPLAYLLKKHSAKPSSIFWASLTALLLHSQFEAWMVGVGSIQLPLFFFYIGSMTNAVILSKAKNLTNDN
ncbi:MAG TPA: O-antigen ligase family protein [Ignavibacteriaceae bacterium]|jgi:hypothetical protein